MLTAEAAFAQKQALAAEQSAYEERATDLRIQLADGRKKLEQLQLQAY